MSTRFFRSIAAVIVTSLVLSQVHVVSAEPSSSESSSSSSSHRSKSSVGSGSSGGSSASKGSNQNDSEKSFKEKASKGTTKVVDGSDGRIIEYSVNDKDLQGSARTTMSEDGKMVVETSAVIEGERATDVFEVTGFLPTGSGSTDFYAELVSKATGETTVVSPDSATPQLFPLAVLAVLAAEGLAAAMELYGEAKIKWAAKEYLLKEVDDNKWQHIMAKKHKWDSVGATTREQIAELMATALVKGEHGYRGKTKSSKVATWIYKFSDKADSGETIIRTEVIQTVYSVRKDKDDKGLGNISNGWVMSGQE